jgi:hypothetical protein
MRRNLILPEGIGAVAKNKLALSSLRHLLAGTFLLHNKSSHLLQLSDHLVRLDPIIVIASKPALRNACSSHQYCNIGDINRNLR